MDPQQAADPQEMMLLDSIAVQVMPFCMQITVQQGPALAGAPANIQLRLDMAAGLALEAGKAYIQARRALLRPQGDIPLKIAEG